MKIDFETAYDYLEELVGANKEALDLAFSLNGCSVDTAESILYYYTGWRSFKGWLDDLGLLEEEEE